MYCGIVFGQKRIGQSGSCLLNTYVRFPVGKLGARFQWPNAFH